MNNSHETHVKEWSHNKLTLNFREKELQSQFMRKNQHLRLRSKIKTSILFLCLFIYISLILCFSRDAEKSVFNEQYQPIAILFLTYSVVIAINLVILKVGGIAMNYELKKILISLIFFIFDCFAMANALVKGDFFGGVFIFVTIMLFFFESQYFESFTIVLVNSIIFLALIIFW